MTVGESPPWGTDPLISHTIADRYRVLRKLGEGGMGAVYLAEHVVIEKRLVLKVLAPELTRRQDLVARFLQEARSASRIGHENVIDISDFGQSAEGYVYIAMEYLEGQDLGEIVRAEGALAWPRVRDILEQICRALRAAHDKGIVHRDMKPENIFLIQREGRPEFVKILDFGIAKVMGVDPNGPRLTRTGMIFGTPEYMSPEQAEGKEADHRVDVYAVGCIAYHLMTGSTPFAAENFMAMLTKHLMEDPVPPSVRRPDLDITPEMDALVLKALEKNRDQRYQNMGEFLEAASACRGPEGDAARLSSGGFTREMGGAHAKAKTAPAPIPATARAATRVGNASERGGGSELVSRDVVEAAAADRPRAPGMDRSVPKMVLAAIGVALGVFAALYFVLSRGQPLVPAPPPAETKVAAPNPAPSVQPAAPVAPSIPSTAAAPTPVAEPAPAEPPQAPTVEPAPVAAPARVPVARKAKGRGAAGPIIKAGTPATPPPALPAPAPSRPAPPPSDLKPFPGM
jgi:eukaryotic-like serine/threonine-protein kinase